MSDQNPPSWEPPSGPPPEQPSPWTQPTQPPPAYGPPPSAPPPAYPPQPPQQPQQPVWGQPAGYGSPGYPPQGPWQGGPSVQPPKRSRTPIVLAIVAAVVVIAAAVTVPLVLQDDEPTTRSASGDQSDPVSSGADESDPPSTDLSEVVEYDGEVTTHVTEHVDYDASPPAGGAHFGYWADCGVYDVPIPDEVGTHDLEHGAFWFTYDPAALDADQVAGLAAQVPQNGIMSPYEGLSAPVVVTVWERQLALTGPDDPRIALFLDEYADGATAPEPLASCAGGLTADDFDAVEQQLDQGSGGDGSGGNA